MSIQARTVWSLMHTEQCLWTTESTLLPVGRFDSSLPTLAAHHLHLHLVLHTHLANPAKTSLASQIPIHIVRQKLSHFLIRPALPCNLPLHLLLLLLLILRPGSSPNRSRSTNCRLE